MPHVFNAHFIGFLSQNTAAGLPTGVGCWKCMASGLQFLQWLPLAIPAHFTVVEIRE